MQNLPVYTCCFLVQLCPSHFFVTYKWRILNLYATLFLAPNSTSVVKETHQRVLTTSKVKFSLSPPAGSLCYRFQKSSDTQHCSVEHELKKIQGLRGTFNFLCQRRSSCHTDLEMWRFKMGWTVVIDSWTLFLIGQVGYVGGELETASFSHKDRKFSFDVDLFFQPFLFAHYTTISTILGDHLQRRAEAAITWFWPVSLLIFHHPIICGIQFWGFSSPEAQMGTCSMNM